jgi:hypothetical protein
MDYFELAEAAIVIGVSIIPIYIATKVFRISRSFFLLSALLGIVFIAHGIYHIGTFLDDALVQSEFEFSAALLVFILSLCYLYMRLNPERYD